jgi:hypothetical protein
VVILQEAPNLPQGCEVLDLDSRKIFQSHARATIELVVQIQRRFGPLDSGCIPNGPAIQQLQIVRPGHSASGDKETKAKLLRFGVDGQGDGIFPPRCSFLQLAILHIVKSQIRIFTVLAHPQAHEVAYIFGANKAAQLDACPREINWD